MRGTPSIVLIDRHGLVRKHAFGAVDDLRIGAEIGALTQESSVGRARPQFGGLKGPQVPANVKRMRMRARCGTALESRITGL